MVDHATDNWFIGSMFMTGLAPGGHLANGSGSGRGDLHCSLVDPVKYKRQLPQSEYDCYGVCKQPYNFHKDGKKGKGKGKDKDKEKKGRCAGRNAARNSDKITDAVMLINCARAYEHGVRFAQARSHGIVTDSHVPNNCLDGWIDTETGNITPWTWPFINQDGVES